MSYEIPKSDYLRGLRLCIRNSRKLLKLADDAFRRECYQAAYLLGFASFEEIGKGMVILNHWDDDFISFRDYKYEMCNHKHKITLALKMINENIMDYFNIVPRGIISPPELDEEHRDNIVYIKTESIYLDYDFEKKKWKRPIKNMNESAIMVIRKAVEALSMISTEYKYRGIRIRKSK